MTEYPYVYIDTRIAGQVTRYHTWPRAREQSVGEHCWQLLRIYSCITDTMDQDFVLHCIYHDCAEIVTGDLPYPVKSTNRELKRTIEMLEDQTLSKQANYWKSLPYRITPEQYALFKMVEMVEMFEWGLDEMNRGCRYGEIVADRCLKIIYERVSSASKPLPEPWHRLCWYMQNRLGLNEFAIHHEKWWTLEEWKRITECVTSS